MQKRVRSQSPERLEAAGDLHDVVTPHSLGLDPQWGVIRSSGIRCERCRRRIRTGEPVLQSEDDVMFCGRCGRHHWLRRIED